MMIEILSYIIPVLALAILAAGWVGVQLLARKMKTKNHIDHQGGCCGACANRDSCDKLIPPDHL